MNFIYSCYRIFLGCICFPAYFATAGTPPEKPIDRYALVNRHNIVYDHINPKLVMSVGNGEMSFNVDVTGLQTFPEVYEKDVPLTTMSNWGWHSFPNPDNYTLKDVMCPLEIRGKTEMYPMIGWPYELDHPAGQGLNKNPHRFHLGQIGFLLLKRDGTEASVTDLKNIKQTLDLWKGTVYSSFEIEGDTVKVTTSLHPSTDNEPVRTLRPLLHQLEDLGLLVEIDVSENIRIQHSIEAIQILKKYFKNEIFVRGNCDQASFSLACSIRTPAEFMMDLIMNEEDSIRLLEYSTRICSQFISLIAKAGSDMVSNGDSPAGPSMISPEMYEQFPMPYEQKMRDVAHQNAVPYLLHICGNTDVILEKMATLNIDAVDLDYKTPIQNIHALMGNRICLFGNIDPSGVMALGTPEMVTQKKQAVIRNIPEQPAIGY